MTEKLRKPIGKLLAALTASAVMLSSLAITAFAAEEEPTVVTIFTTNDIHGAVYGGSISLDTVAAVKTSTPNSLLVDAGDATQGTSFATITRGEDVISVMNAAGYDLLVPGNHEFDYGTGRLMTNSEAASFPFISANVLFDGEPMFDGTTTVEVGGYTIGFVGITTSATATNTSPSYIKGVEFTGEITAAEKGISSLADEGADAIIIVAHLGNEEAAVPCTSEKLLEGLSDSALSKVTAFVDGHSHTVEETVFEKDGVSVPIVQTGTQLANLGQLTITFDSDDVYAEVNVLSAEELADYPITSDGEAAADRVAEILNGISAEQQEILDEVLCENNTPLWGGYIYWDYAETRIVETNYGDFVTDAFAEYGQIFADSNGLDLPVIAVENGGGISSTLPYGTVTRGDVLNAFNHGNTVVALQLSSSELFEALESGLTMTGQDDTGLLIREKPSGSFLQVSGFTYTYDPSADIGSKVVSVVLDDGTSLDRTSGEHKLLLITNNYVGSWFDSEDKVGELGGEDFIVESYILRQTEDGTKPLSVPTDGGRIRIANDTSPDTYAVVIPVLDGEEALANRVIHVSIDGGEAEEYVTDENGNATLTLTKGPHTLYLVESTDNMPVYVNNYSGSGTVTTADGYYRLAFESSAAQLEAADPDHDTEKPTDTEQPSDTEKPTDTEQPSDTEKPTDTEQPSNTENPSNPDPYDSTSSNPPTANAATGLVWFAVLGVAAAAVTAKKRQ